jgi:hypothetical protein
MDAGQRLAFEADGEVVSRGEDFVHVPLTEAEIARNGKIVVAFGRKLLDEHGLKTWFFSVEDCQHPKWPNATHERFGFCLYSEQWIAVDVRFLKHHSGLRPTILHEITHALLGPRYRVLGGHGPKFCKLARKLGCRTWFSVGQYECANLLTRCPDLAAV